MLTINLRHDSDQWPRRFELIANEITRLDPDLIGLQELSISQNQGPYLNSLLEKRGHPKYEIIAERKTGAAAATGEGIGVMSRWPIAEHSSADLGNERVAILARITTPNGILDFANTHLDQHRDDDGEMNRDQETIELLELLAREDDCRPTILTGDLNSTDKGHAMARLRSARFEDSWVKANGPNAVGNTAMIKLETGAFEQHPRRRIDFILARPAGERTLTPVTSEVVFKNQDGKGFYPSDHFGVFTTFDAKL